MVKRNWVLASLVITGLLVFSYLVFQVYSLGAQKPEKIVTKNIKTVYSPTPTKYQFPYKVPAIPKNRSYRLVIVGDSIVKSLGINANSLRQNLIKLYPDSEFVIYNYGYSSTNILSVPARLTEKTNNDFSENDAILRQGFEVIILESFGYNPLSESSLGTGLKKQEETLDEILNLILTEKPNSAILFMTPIAPDPENFAKGTLDLSKEQRKSWVEERVSYIENFKKYAEKKEIPLINVYSASLNSDGSVNRTYISGDFIHPSEKGIELMSAEIAKFIFNNKILPQ